MPEMQHIDVGEVTLRCAIEGEGPLAIMVHGFPESWYSWRHQIGPVADAGFTACAIDVRAMAVRTSRSRSKPMRWGGSSAISWA